MDHFAGMCVPLPEDGGEADVDAGDEVANSDAGATEPGSGTETVDDGGDSASCLPQAEICGNKLDDDCDGEMDEESEGSEKCNGLDDNCDGLVDEDLLDLRPNIDIWPGASIRQWGGRWFLSGADGDGALTLIEVRFDSARPLQFFRLLNIDGPNPGDLGVTTGRFPGQNFGGVTALLPLEQTLLVSSAGGSRGNLTQFSESDEERPTTEPRLPFI
jgi:hypothetical protein